MPLLNIVDLRVSLEEFMSYQTSQFEAAEGRPMTSFEESYERLHFRRLDADGSGYVDYPEFLKFSAGKYLSRRSKVMFLIVLNTTTYGRCSNDADLWKR